MWVLLCASCGWGHRAPPVQSLHIECSPPMPVLMLPTLHKEEVEFREEGSRVSVCLCREPCGLLCSLGHSGSVLCPEKCFIHSCGEMYPSPSPCLFVPAGFMSPKCLVQAPWCVLLLQTQQPWSLAPWVAQGICVAAVRHLEAFRLGGHCHPLAAPGQGKGTLSCPLETHCISQSLWPLVQSFIFEVVAWDLTVQGSLGGSPRACPHLYLHLGSGHCPSPYSGLDQSPERIHI